MSPKHDDVELYAPAVSMVALRTMLTVGARHSDSMRVLDLDNAFLNAEIKGPDAFISLPPIWRSANEKPVRKLRRALYGLPQTPKLWYSEHTKGLTSLGWHKCPHEGGVWRKRSRTNTAWIKLAVYVDDNVLLGPDDSELTFGVTKILELL